ncbi:MAG TPA: sigma-70 family RNA polymerase sigma factor [Polyangia bacterium]|nr:sigma-70 family RNA polymerase sigma factor [Polyangia bacterium]
MLSFLLAIGARLTAARDEEAELVAAVARGEREPLRHLYDRLAGHALAVAVRVLGSRPEAEEVVQDVFVDVWTRAALFDATRGTARTWVLSMTRNRSIDRVRSRGAAARLVDGVRGEAAVAPAGTTPLESAVSRETREQIQSALDVLSAGQRQVLELGYFEGLSQSEIAERLGQPLGTVKSRVRAALEKLAAAVAGRGGAA